MAALTIFQFNVYGRYLLLILPPLIILVAGRLARLAARGRGLRFGFAILLLASGIWSVSQGGSLGVARRANDGLDALAAHLNAKPDGDGDLRSLAGLGAGLLFGPLA